MTMMKKMRMITCMKKRYVIVKRPRVSLYSYIIFIFNISWSLIHLFFF
jgi:hypothetical protein